MHSHLQFVYSLAVLALWLAPLALAVVWLSSRAIERLRARVVPAPGALTHRRA